MKKLTLVFLLLPSLAYSQVDSLKNVIVLSEKKLDAFLAQRQTGKTFQIIGALGIGTALVMNSKFQDQLKAGRNPKPVPAVLPLFSTIVLTAGIVIDMSARDKLKRRK